MGGDQAARRAVRTAAGASTLIGVSHRAGLLDKDGRLPRMRQALITDKISRRLAAGEQGMVVWWSMKAGAHAAAHKHRHEQIAWMLKGKMEFRLGDERRTCGPGDIVVIPGGIEHEAFFPKDTEVIDIFAPPREDFLAGGVPGYMRK